MITAALQPTALSIRHSRFATLTLAKLVASLALHPPSSATGRGGLRASPPPAAEPLLKEKPLGGCTLQLSPIAAPDSRTQSATPWHADFNRRRACAARPKGESRKRTEESLLSSGRFRLSPATGASGQGHSQFYFNRLSRHTQVLCFFPCTPRATALRQARVSGGNLQNCAPSAACGGAMTQERNVFSSSPFVPSHGRAMPSAQAAST